MGTVYLSLAMSLDGFITGPIPVLESPWVRAVNGCTSGWQGWRTSASAVTRSALTLRFSAHCLAVKMLVSRARRRVQDAATAPDADLARQREVVAAFLAASRHGDFEALLAVLDPDVILRADRADGRVKRGPRCAGRGRHILAACPVRTTGARQRSRRNRVAPADGHESYSASRSGAGRSSRSTWSPTPAPAPARPDDPRRLTLSAAHR
jgi:ketosteroid isomerase-like protein